MLLKLNHVLRCTIGVCRFLFFEFCLTAGAQNIYPQKELGNFLNHSSERLTNFVKKYQVQVFKILGINNAGFSNENRLRNSINASFELFGYKMKFIYV